MSVLDILRAYDNPVDRAVALAVGAHAGQVDKQKQPYILHVLRVGLAGKTDDERVTGILHDLLEDSDYSEADLHVCRFSEDVISAVVALTHKKGQSNNEYYEQIRGNPLALQVKHADIDDNYNRLESLENDMIRQRLTAKYDRARKVLFGGQDAIIALDNMKKIE